MQTSLQRGGGPYIRPEPGLSVLGVSAGPEMPQDMQGNHLRLAGSGPYVGNGPWRR